MHSRKVRLRFAKVLIAFSCLLMFIGLSYYIEDSYKILDPIKDTKVVVSSEKNPVSITTVDGLEPENTSDSSTPNNESGNSNDSVSSSDGSNNSNDSTGGSAGSSFNNGNTPSVGNSGSSQTTPTQPTAPSIDDININLRNSIQDNYSIYVKYGLETSGYSVGGLSTVALSDSTAINSALNNLASVMALYPSGFFSEMRNSGFNLTVYLIKSYSAGNVTGVTNHSTKNVEISIATDFPLADSLNHEIFHYIDYYIEKKGGRYTTWNNLNPSGFIYGNINNAYSYNMTLSEDAFFVNGYAQTDEYEDRASTFEYMMAANKASCLNYGKTVWLKSKYMAEQVDYFYSSVSPNVTEYWERFIY